MALCAARKKIVRPREESEIGEGDDDLSVGEVIHLVPALYGPKPTAKLVEIVFDVTRDFVRRS
jgi:hypothetical protein